jgi:formate hydrogenlyase subunit 3/multisubunit Na+/H+ antiporter MnhD subunit
MSATVINSIILVISILLSLLGVSLGTRGRRTIGEVLLTFGLIGAFVGGLCLYASWPHS